MKYRLLEWLACPSCRSSDLAVETRKTEEIQTGRGVWEESERDLPGVDIEAGTVTEIIEGGLVCGGCGAAWPIVDGVPRMLPVGDPPGPASGHRWTQFDGAAPEYEENFRDMTHPMGPKDYLGKLVLDAGCGFGRHAFYAARYGAEVVALDSSADAVASAYANTSNLTRAHVVQGDLLNPPLRAEVFDFVFCFGVLHHLVGPRAGFEALTRMVAHNGRLQVWVYGPRQGGLAIVAGALRGAASTMGDEELYRFSKRLASGLRLFSHTPYRLWRRTPVMKSVVSHLPAHDHHQWPFDVVVADVYDRLRVPVTAPITGEELERWYADEGYADIHVNRRVRNNESFRGLGVRR